MPAFPPELASILLAFQSLFSQRVWQYASVAGYVGSSKALSYTVIGDTANTSARLCGIALSGQVLVSEYTLARLGPRFEVEELPPAHLKGKEKPLRIFNVKREKPSAALGAAARAG